MTKRKIRILIVDDEERDVLLMTRAIERAGAALVFESSPDYETAIQQVRSEYYHLLLLDLKLHENGPYDQESFEGLWLLQDREEMGFREYLPVVILTGYGSQQIAVQAFRKYNIVDFIDKGSRDHWNESFLSRRLKEIITDELGINLELDVSFKGGLNWESLSGGIAYRTDEQIPSPTKGQKREELEDLFCKLFHSAHLVEIRPFERGHSGAGVVKVTPYDRRGNEGAEVVVKYGGCLQVGKENANFDRYVQPYTRGARRTQKERFDRTLHLGGIIYTLIGVGNQRVRSFNDYYAKEDDPEKIKKVLTNLFEETCGLWYENRRDEKEHDLMDLYTEHLVLTPEKLKRAFQFKFTEEYTEEEQFSFPQVERSFTNPVMAFCREQARFSAPSHLCITHGDLNGTNVLVDESGNTWLIDFYGTNWKHCLWDLTQLETVIKFRLTLGANLGELYSFEEALLSPTEFGEIITPPSGATESLSKAVEVISHLRNIAEKEVEPRKNQKEYYAALFYHTINLLRLHRLIKRRITKNHVLLSASMLYEKVRRMR